MHLQWRVGFTEEQPVPASHAFTSLFVPELVILSQTVKTTASRLHDTRFLGFPARSTMPALRRRLVHHASAAANNFYSRYNTAPLCYRYRQDRLLLSDRLQNVYLEEIRI